MRILKPSEDDLRRQWKVTPSPWRDERRYRDYCDRQRHEKRQRFMLTPAYGQGNKDSVSASSVAIAFLSNVTSGNLICVGIGWASTSATLTSVTDSQSNTYTLKHNPTTQVNARAAMAYAVAGSSAACTVTATLSGSVNPVQVIIHEVSGTNSTPFDQSAMLGQNPGTTNLTSGNVTTTTNGQYIFGFQSFGDFSGPTITPGTGYTQRQQNDTGSEVSTSEDQIQASLGTIAATFFTNKWSNDYIVGIMTFKAAAAAGRTTKNTRASTLGTEVGMNWRGTV